MSDRDNPGAAYQFERSEGGIGRPLQPSSSRSESLQYSAPNNDSESYEELGGTSSLTGMVPSFHHSHDATDRVREMHLALLYLLSNPEEFQGALQMSPPRGATTLAEWNAEYENESTTDAGSYVTSTESTTTLGPTPLPFVVFADDAEVVLPQAHTCSQIFGLERIEGIELEAAAGIPSLSQLFLRWLALMPGGDHLNMIDPPGLTVMRIAGGRYRVTAAHRVVWTWMNEFAALPEAYSHDEVGKLQVGDLVSMTIVDVFETDSQGKLLSYCPTFDNRAVHKTSPASETIRKSSSKFMILLAKVQNSSAARGLMGRAKSVASNVRSRIEEAAANYHHTSPRRGPHSEVGSDVTDVQRFTEGLSKAEAAAVGPVGTSATSKNVSSGDNGPVKEISNCSVESTRSAKDEPSSKCHGEGKDHPKSRSEHYISDSDDAFKEL